MVTDSRQRPIPIDVRPEGSLKRVDNPGSILASAVWPTGRSQNGDDFDQSRRIKFVEARVQQSTIDWSVRKKSAGGPSVANHVQQLQTVSSQVKGRIGGRCADEEYACLLGDQESCLITSRTSRRPLAPGILYR